MFYHHPKEYLLASYLTHIPFSTYLFDCIKTPGYLI
nr:MAG TPA: hypothetical protein [Caudoviricetes sp.]